jgi:hypothetical protein
MQACQNTDFLAFWLGNILIRLFIDKISESTCFQAKILRKGTNLFETCILVLQSIKTKMSSLSKYTFFRFSAWKQADSIIYR